MTACPNRERSAALAMQRAVVSCVGKPEMTNSSFGFDCATQKGVLEGLLRVVVCNRKGG